MAKDKTADKKGKNAKDKNAKDAKGKKGKKGTKGKGAPQFGERSSVSSHPRAAAHVRKAKGWGGLGGFALAAYMSYAAEVPPDQIVLRALAAGLVGYMLCWACAVTIWRHLVLAEMKALLESGRMVLGTDPKADAAPGDAADRTTG
jgi:hypothetical protein